MFDFSLTLEARGADPMYLQLYRYICREIQSARLRGGTKLPSPRKLSEHLGISKTTVDSAYQQLVAEGYVEGRARSGYYVLNLEVDYLDTRTPEPNPAIPAEVNTRAPDVIGFHGAQVEVDYRLLKTWRRFTNEAFDFMSTDIALYGSAFGEDGLRRELANYLRYSRGANCTEEQIVLCSGTQQAIGLLCQFLRNIDTTVGFEEPGYHDARLTFQNHGFRTIPIALDGEGLDVGTLRQSPSRFVYVTPANQFPLGIVMPVSRRLQLLKWASDVDGYIIEDDYDGEFRYYSHPIPCMQGLDVDGRVIYLGTFSKSLMPTIRVSYMVLPKRLVTAFRTFYNYDCAVSRIHQATLEKFMASGEWLRHIRRTRKLYQQKREVLVGGIRNWLGNRAKVVGVQAGLRIGLRLDTLHSVQELADAALRVGVQVYTYDTAWTPPNVNPGYLFLGYGGLSFQDIRVGIDRLKHAWADFI